MRIWLILCVFTSLVLTYLLLSSIQTSVQNRHEDSGRVSYALQYRYESAPREPEPIEVAHMIELMQDGDTLTVETRQLKLRVLPAQVLYIATLERPGSSTLVRRFGAFPFFLSLIGLPTAPVAIWVIVFLATRSGSHGVRTGDRD